MRGSALAACMLIPATLLPLPTVVGASYSICDLPPMPSKCVAALAAGVEACASVQLSGTFIIFPVTGEGRGCFAGVGAASAAVSLALPTAQVFGASAATGVEEDECALHSETNLEIIACGTGVAAAGTAGCLVAASQAEAHNGLGVITTPLAEYSAGTCKGPSLGGAQIGIMKQLGGRASEAGSRSAHRLDELTPASQEALKEAVFAQLRESLDAQTGSWPDDEMHDALRATLTSQLARAVARISGASRIWISEASP